MLSLITDLLWSKVLIALLIALGVTFTVASNFSQFRYFGRMFRLLGRSFRHEGNHLSSFQALAMSVAGRVGAGNIAGVAVAITLGGPGAIFWMWVVGLMGMATSIYECSLAQLFKQTEPDGSYRGGPAFYIKHGLKNRWMAHLFSVLLMLTFGFAFPSLQSFTVSSSFESAFSIPAYATGIALAAVVGIIIFGGVRRIADAAQYVVPFMAIGYLVVALRVIGTNIESVPDILSLIVNSAFGLEQAVGGGVGAAILMGVKRGLFSNEAGLGSAPNTAAISYVKHPVEQGILQAFSVFVDTVILCTCTAIIILLSDIYQSGTDLGGVALTQNALAEHVGGWGVYFVSIALALFAFTSVMYSYYLGENSLSFMFGEKTTIFNAYRFLFLVLVVWGSAQNLSTVFAFADLTMGLLAIINLVALALLIKPVKRILNDYDQQLNQGVEEPQLDINQFNDLDLDKTAWVHPEEASSLAEGSPEHLLKMR
ncbi:alanine/glycine:cation symporter family protein [Marinobacterium mangrovicola]|uniref:AGCS family alanine or glycine:cation symporter n=1 Tax=Marinobacterium mangrovicola TaxID=1476959 RepID=A0A4R1G5N7_9GAMM|nr:alanine/glycine:cation symporter family protein [Marinobacterium mangrovicola]TCK02964.1 AGCS family alanine or glycine:cation symporter [Marinobacterium mangrovicola]